MKGAAFEKYLELHDLSFFNSFNAHFVLSLVSMAHIMLTCEWMPLRLRPFVSGLFWPFFLFVLMDYKTIIGFQSDDNQN
jgi:hypothetical protein